MRAVTGIELAQLLVRHHAGKFRRRLLAVIGARAAADKTVRQAAGAVGAVEVGILGIAVRVIGTGLAAFLIVARLGLRLQSLPCVGSRAVVDRRRRSAA